MQIAVAILLLQLSAGFQVQKSHGDAIPKQDRTTEILALLKQLYPIETETSVKARKPGMLQNVELRLKQIAEQSEEARTQVVDALIRVVRDERVQREWPIASLWIMSVDILGALRATEALDILVENLDRTGENGIMSSINFAPVTRALIKIGKPAVPALIKALGASKEEIQFQAANTLAGIGRPAVSELLDALTAHQPLVKAGAAMALAQIGGEGVEQAITRAVEIENDERLREELKKALTEYNRRWKN